MLIRRTQPMLAHLEWRIRLFGAGAILAIVGIWFEQDWLVNLAIGVLLVGFGLRFLGRREHTASDDDGSEETHLQR
jgi:hypothetical protein